MDVTELFGPVIHSYTRAQAIADGVLVEAPAALVADAGIAFPVVLTRAAWADCVQWTETEAERTGAYQDEDGRLWDVLWMTRIAILKSRSSSRAVVQLYRISPNAKPDANGNVREELVELIAVCGPGDDGAPVITVMFAHED